MRKTILFFTCCIGLMLLASCKKDPTAPTINILQGENHLYENAEVYSDEPVRIGFVATGEKLTKIEVVISQNGAVLTSNSKDIDEVSSYTYSSSFVITATGTVTITGTVTDAVGQTASKSFNIFCNEKPSAKFIGHYEGNALATGSMEVEITGMGMEPIQDVFTDREVPVILDITAGDNMNEVVATCIIDERTMTTKGNVEGDKVTFETINDVITFDYDTGIMTINPQINVTYNIVGTLSEGQLMLDGNCTGNGDMNYVIFSGTITLEATVGGSLNKMQ